MTRIILFDNAFLRTMVENMKSTLEQIEQFILDHKMGASTFGLLAKNERHLVFELRKGRRMWPETEEKIKSFMASYEPVKKETKK